MIEDNLNILFLIVLAIILFQYILMRRQIKSVADPLAYFVITSAFSLALGCVALDDGYLLARIFTYFLCFYFGFGVAFRRVQREFSPLEMDSEISRFRSIVIICSLVYLALNAIVWFKSGIILLSEDPSLQKSDAYAGGWGFIRRFNWGVGVFVLIASFYWWLKERSVTAAFTVILVSLTALTGGGKSALLPLVFAIGLYIAKPFITNRGTSVAHLRRRVPLFMTIALVPVAIILIAEQGSAKNAFDAFVVRMFYFGDILLYWGQQTIRDEFSKFGLLDYLSNSLGSILGALRLIEYNTPIGNQFVQATLPAGVDFAESLGPNLPFYVRGELYFGSFMAFLHAFIIGFSFGYLRRLFVVYCGHSLLRYSILAFLVVVSIMLPTEEGLAIGQAFDFIVFFIPIYITISIYRTCYRRLNYFIK